MVYHFIDGNYLIHRSIHKGQGLTYNGLFTGGAFIFLRVLFSLNNIKNTIVVFDGGHSQRRKKLLESYKVKKELDENFKNQFKITQKILKEILLALGIAIVQIPGQEADDIIYWLTTKHYQNKSIVHTDDEDYLQLLQWNVKIHRPMKGEFYESANDFIDKFGYHPKYLTLKKALMGDVSDNIPGIKGIGNKRATQIVQEMYKRNLEPEILELIRLLKTKKESWAKRIIQNIEIVERNLKLIDFKFVDLSNLDIKVKFPTFDLIGATQKLQKYGFKSLVAKLIDF